MKSLQLAGFPLLIALVCVSNDGLLAAEPAQPSNEQTKPLKPGDKAPDFKLAGSDGKTYRLADFRKKDKEKVVVVAWFPKAFTPGCTAECKSFAEEGKKLRALGVAYFTASCDTAELNKKFAESLKLDFPVLSDPDRKTALAYGVVDAQRQWAQRWTFYIGTDGKILLIDKKVRTGTHAADVAEQLQKLGVGKRP